MTNLSFLANLTNVNQLNCFFIMERRILSNGEEAKVIIVLHPAYNKYSDPVDDCDYKHKAIIGLIPAIETPERKFISPVDGSEITLDRRANVQIRNCSPGHEFKYPDGEVILCGSNRGKVYFADKFDKDGVEKLRGFYQDTVKYPKPIEDEKI